jgi:MYXO-CTERM domain-containing protein
MAQSRLKGLLALAVVMASGGASAAPPPKASAAPASDGCEGKLVLAVDNAKAVFIGRTKKIEATNHGSTYVLHVTYTVDRALEGTKVAEVTVEESCRNEPLPNDLAGFPASGQYCLPDQHPMPGLTPDGRMSGGNAVLLLRGLHKNAEGRDVASLVRENPWSPCPDPEPVYKRKPALRALVKTVAGERGGTSYGFLAPPPPVAAPPSASASAAPAPSASAAASSSATPAPSSSAAPTKRFGCNAAPSPRSAWPFALVVVALFALRRRAR